jgi:DNA polymerase III subunit delta
MAPPGRDADPLAALRNEEPGPLYFISGRERFFVDRAVDILRARVLDPRTKDFNQDVFHGKDARASSIMSAARTLPMMAKRRLVLVREADEMKAEELSALVPYVQKPCAETCLVLVAEKADQRLKFFTAFKKTGQQLKFEPLYENKLPGFVNEEARMRGVKFEPGVAQMVCDEVGAELGQLADAIERLAIFVGDKKTISAADVEQVVATTRQRNVFELCNAVGEGDRGRALAVLGSMLGAREAPVRIVAMLARHVRQLWTAHGLLKRKLDKFELAQALGVPPFFVDGIAAQARKRDAAGFARMHDAVFRADKTLKSSRLDDDRIMEQLILELTDRGSGGSAPVRS